MKRPPALVCLFGFVVAASMAACSAKHEEHPPILTECGESCNGGGVGGGGSSTPTDSGTTAADVEVDDSAPPDDAGLAIDSGLGLLD